MSNVIPFPKREPENMQVVVEETDLPTDCTELIHVFDTTPGNCKCGKNSWDPPDEPVSLLIVVAKLEVGDENPPSG